MLTMAKDLETGVKKIDEQHKELFERINAVTSAGMASISKVETEKTLNFLSDYVSKHFSDEEKLQEESSYPGYQAHKALHTGFISELKALKQEYNQNGASPTYTMKLNKAIIDWLVKHIKSEDMKVAKHYIAYKR